MKKSIFVLLLICGFASSSKADTISTWQFLYNGKEIKSCTKNCTITLSSSKINKLDSISLLFYRCLPCSYCKPVLTIYDIKTNKIVIQRVGKSSDDGDFEPISFTLAELLIYRNKSKNNLYRISYAEIPTNMETDNPKFKRYEDRKIFGLVIN